MSNLIDRQEARKSMGFCLQQNVIYDSLSAEDHLKFIAKLREIPDREVDGQVSQIRLISNLKIAYVLHSFLYYIVSILVQAYIINSLYFV